MKKQDRNKIVRQLLILLKYVAITGNIILVLWILYNGMNEGFTGSALEKLSYIGLMGLLILNSILLYLTSKIKQDKYYPL